jgi:phage terminase small subunit
MFAHAYIANGRNGTQAAITAGFAPASAQVTASQLLSDPMVRELVDELTANLQEITGLTTERVLRETGRVAFFDRRKLYRPDGTEKPPTEWDDDTAAAISHVNATGPVPFDKNAALEKAFRHLGLYERDNRQRPAENMRVVVELVGDAVPAPTHAVQIEQPRQRANLRLLDADVEWKG